LDLFQPLQIDRDPRERLDGDTPVVARATARSGVDGMFTLDRVPQPPFLLVAASSTQGRASVWVAELGAPIDLRVTAPPRARGRVVRNRLPVAGARVRFVPASEAWAASTDPAAQLTDETTSADDGTFTLILPDQRLGEILVV